PYSSGEANEKSFYSSISGGLGFRTSRYMLDFAVVNTTWEQEYYLYGNTMADLSASSLRFVGSLSFRF
ncbi:MAG: hypothetical protein HOK84_06015, partial [Bacteroidetes bacterium]|nr:hypothetical protein [Bacteroidota bacterium]